MISETNYSVVNEMDRRKIDLGQQVEAACKNATDLKTSEKNQRREMLRMKQQIESQDTIELSFGADDELNTVYVENTHEYLILIRLSLRQIIKSNYNYTDEDLDDEDYASQCANWYAENTERHIGHEMGHYFGAKEYTDLECRLGVVFTVNSKGVYNFYPVTSLQGSVRADTFIECVINGPHELSEMDRLVCST